MSAISNIYQVEQKERLTVGPEATKSKLRTASDGTRVACAAILGDGGGKEVEQDKKEKGELSKE